MVLISFAAYFHAPNGIFLIKPPRKRGPTLKKTEAPRSDRGYICYNSGGVFRQSFSAACNCCCLLKFRIRPHLGIMKKLR